MIKCPFFEKFCCCCPLKVRIAFCFAQNFCEHHSSHHQHCQPTTSICIYKPTSFYYELKNKKKVEQRDSELITVTDTISMTTWISCYLYFLRKRRIFPNLFLVLLCPRVILWCVQIYYSFCQPTSFFEKQNKKWHSKFHIPINIHMIVLLGSFWIFRFLDILYISARIRYKTETHFWCTLNMRLMKMTTTIPVSITILLPMSGNSVEITNNWTKPNGLCFVMREGGGVNRNGGYQKMRTEQWCAWPANLKNHPRLAHP